LSPTIRPTRAPDILRDDDIVRHSLETRRVEDKELQTQQVVEFQAGMIAGLLELGGDIFATVSDGCNIPPIGVLDDVKTEAFSKQSIDERVFIKSTGVPDGYGNLISTVDTMGFLNNTNIIPSTFAASMDVLLNPRNGVVQVPAGSVLNSIDPLDPNKTGFEVFVSYTFQIPDLPGEDTTAGSGKVSVHIFRAIFSTDQFDPVVEYPLMAPLYCGRDGRVTTEANGPIIGIVTAPPSVLINDIEFMWL